MTGRSRQTRIWKSVAISIAILAALVIVAGCKKKSPKQPEKPDTRPNINATTSLNDVIRSARTWRPAYTSWYGKTAPDFTLTDLGGKEHKLSDYRGKDVVLVFWARWCKYCTPEIPHLIELRNTVSEDKLAILAITYEKPEPVKKFVADNRMNYTVLLEKGNMPVPFGVIRIYRTAGLPCSFFINREGKIKLATVGMLTLDSINAILQAE
ncbi:MAG: peroxiredoxin family protein [Planctomycetota bacterium]